MVSLLASGVLLVSILATLYYSAKVGQDENARGQLRINMEKALEMMKHDVHLSNSNGILFYPTNAASYTAISIPIAKPSTSGFLTFSGGFISWNATSIYHLYTTGGKTELRRTVFSSYQTNPTTRQTQLNNVVANGDGRAGPGSYTTTTVYSSDGGTALTIYPQFATFDGYASQTSRSEYTSFGSVQLSPGTHTITFTVTSKNGASSGYKMGLDSFVLSPSGCQREAEALLPVSNSSGKSVVTEDMSAFSGSWGGNYHVEYQSTAAGDYFSLPAYYDLWLESNFDQMTHNSTAVYGPDPNLSVATREDQSLLPAWKAQTQTSDITGGLEYQSTSVETIRSVINGAQIQRQGNMMRIKFSAGSSGSGLQISGACFGIGDPATGSFIGGTTPLYFSNSPLPIGSQDPVGVITSSGPLDAVIPPNNYIWTNWFPCSIVSPDPYDYLVSFVTTSGSVAATWTHATGTTQSFVVNGNHLNEPSLSSPNTYSQLIGVEQVATWIAQGTATSQIYDTKMDNPIFNQISWVSTLPGASTVSIRILNSDNADMSGATWSGPIATSPAALGAYTANGRYIQFQTTLTTASPYTANYPKIDNVKIDWPGDTALVEVSGVYTKRPNYGIFKVQIDGSDPVKALEFQLSSSMTVKGKTFNLTLKSEERPGNTGK